MWMGSAFSLQKRKVFGYTVRARYLNGWCPDDTALGCRQADYGEVVMATVRYTVSSGSLLAEKRGGSRKCYRTDAVGSTVSLYDNSQAKTDTFTYWPYGEDRVVSNPTGTKYKFVGGYQCRTQSDGGIYMRARVEEPRDGRFMTVDPYWPTDDAYSYAGSAPTSQIDPSGLKPCFGNGVDPDCKKFGFPFAMAEFVATKSCQKLLDCLSDKKSNCRQRLTDCLKNSGCTDPVELLDSMRKQCDGTYCIDIWCCKKGCCGCDGSQWFRTYQGKFGLNCGINYCYNFSELSPQDQVAQFLHEISHCCGTPDYGDTTVPCAGQDVAACVWKVMF